ncbi:hypothetical protein M408DRAFT_177493 [Serendipita vermifera MAFF 305830]|uniref:Glutamine amidotransferase type-2 domain-containing protein n=1 Tax=Serendipita vermifera MAFF 305830 TaxID=933852 RepID=A0A0C3B5M2_SERVB|nr:hypothetical protein M408DRAFT_177493 [Serendipita vermifera MAFF 305830]
MCRLFAYIGHEEALLEDVLVNPAHAIIRQVHDHYLPGLIPHGPEIPPKDVKAARKQADEQNKFFNIDGFGVAFYTNNSSEFTKTVTGPRPATYKSIAPAITDPTFLSLCANISSRAIVAHVRATSLSPVVVTNCHPFTFGRHTFAHNGYVSLFDKVRRELSLLIKEEYFASMRGTTDSEHIAALYMTHLDASSGDKGNAAERPFGVTEMRDALARAIKDVQDIQESTLTSEELTQAANSLNLVATDGEKLVAVRWRNHPSEQPPSLYVSTTAGITLNRKYPTHLEDSDPKEAVKGGSKHHLEQRKLGVEKEEHGLHIIVASEPTTFRPHEWTLLDKNHGKPFNLTGV